MENLTLEETLKKLEETVDLLENSGTDFDQAVKLYEQGSRLTLRARTLLDGYEKRITVLKKENGEICEKDWTVDVSE